MLPLCVFRPTHTLRHRLDRLSWLTEIGLSQVIVEYKMKWSCLAAAAADGLLKRVTAKARRVEESTVTIDVGDERTVCRRLTDFNDHSHPLASGSLVKTVSSPNILLNFLGIRWTGDYLGR